MIRLAPPTLNLTRQAVIVLATLMILAGCSSTPEALKGNYAPLEPAQASVRDLGADVRWGGVILDARPDARQTCFEVLSRDLDRSYRPRAEDVTQGRFIACRDGFLDPEVFAKGREITLTGSLVAVDERQVGEFNYRYPVLTARFITMWPDRPDVIINNYNDPWGYGPYWGPYWGGYYGGFYGRGFGWGGYPATRTTVRTGGSNSRVDVPEGGEPQQD
ncbi:MAG: Slp family lipoprotein [Xanthomonadales bacterium]|jgi:outer membrane lipoprotein|nr:Slp family lipoprotein [Xanthomonadales bacterium]